MSRTGQRVRHRRAVRGLTAAVVAGVIAVGAAGCSSTVGGEATAIPTAGDYPQPAIQAAGMDGVTCASNPLPFDTDCPTSAPTPRDIPSGSNLSLRAGDPIILTTASGKSRACAIGMFAKDAAGAIYAVSGAGCATSTGTATTTDGYKLGDFRTVIVRTATIRYMPVVKLADGVKWSQSAKTLGTSTAVSGAVTAHTPHGDGKWEGTSVNALLWRGPGAAPAMKPGDAGSPIIQGTTLVGLGDQAHGITPVDQLGQVLNGIGSGAQLAT